MTVRGTGTVHARPDKAELAFTVTAVAREIHEAMADVARRSERLAGVLFDLAVPPEARSTTGLTAHREVTWEDGRQVDRGYRANYVLRVALTSPDLIGEVVRRAIEESGAHVAGPWWSISPDNPAHLEACRLAAADARRRAEAFAADLGAVAGPVLSAAEPATRPSIGAGGSFGYTPMAAVRSAKGMPEQDLSVEPGEMEVAVALDVTFALDPVGP